MILYLIGCGILGFNIILFIIKNEKLVKYVYYFIESDCMRLDVCVDIFFFFWLDFFILKFLRFMWIWIFVVLY